MSDDDQFDLNEFNARVIAEFRSNGGRVGGRLEGVPLLLLHHRGARTGTERVNPVTYQAVGDAFALFAANAGGPAHPRWYHNLLANPRTSVEVGTDVVEVVARVADGHEREVIWNRQKERAPVFAEYEETARAANRTIPVVIVTPAG